MMYYIKGANQLITAKWNLDKQCELAHKKIILPDSQDTLLSVNDSLNNDLTLTIQNIVVK